MGAAARSDRSDAISDEQVNAHFRANVAAMIEIARENRIPIAFALNAWNPRESDLVTPSVVSLDTLPPARWLVGRPRYAAAVEATRAGECERALAAFDDVIDLYGRAAAARDSLLALYRGECFERLGRFEEARAELAKRIAPRERQLNQILIDVTSEHGVPLLDLPRVLEEHAVNGLVGYHDFFIDSVHMTLGGYRLFGRTLALKVDEWGLLGALPAPPAWELDPEIDDPFPPQFRNVKMFTSFAWSAFHQGRTHDSIALAREALERSPGALQAHLLLGYAYQKLGDVEQTQATLSFLREHWTQATD